MDSVTIYIELPTDLQATLLEAGVTVGDLLLRQNIDMQISYRKSLAISPEGSTTKDLVPVIMATGAAVSIVLFAISRVLSTIYHRPHVIEWEELAALKEDGQIVLDAAGHPVLYTTKKYGVLQPAPDNIKSTIDFSAHLDGVVCRVKQA